MESPSIMLVIKENSYNIKNSKGLKGEKKTRLVIEEENDLLLL